MVRMGITMHESLAKRMDEYAEKNYMTRSAFVSMAVRTYLDSQELKTVFRELNATLKEISDKEMVDEESQAKLDKLSELVEFMSDGTMQL